MTMTLMDLRTAAEDEARRIGSTRALTQSGDKEALVHLEGEAAWIAFARRPRLRRALAGRICLVWRVAFEDRSGRLVDARLVPVLADVGRVLPPPHSFGETAVAFGEGGLDPAPNRSNHIRSLLRDAEDVIRARVEAACDEWADSATQAARAFAEARRAREEAIARLPQRRRGPSQPGLFDRRSERAQQAQAAINDEAGEAALERVRSMSDGLAIVRQPARLLLVLVP
jgi:hypothetical protein